MGRNFLFYIGILGVMGWWMTTASGCAQIGFPTGGAKDSIPPRLVKATPPSGSTRFSVRRIVLQFDEFVDVQELQKNLFISPPPKVSPVISFNLRTVTIQLKDTPAPNTTYNIQFGDAIRDLNEGNPLRGFSYLFSTGDIIDSLTLSGNLQSAETGLADSTLIAMLYRNLSDSAPATMKPDFIARLNGAGEFRFSNLPSGTFRLYALKDEDGSRTYNSKKEIFGFFERPVRLPEDATVPAFYAYAEERAVPVIPSLKPVPEKKLRVLNPPDAIQDMNGPLSISFNNPLKDLDTALLYLADSNYKRQDCIMSVDSSRRQVSVSLPWKPGMSYRFIIAKNAISDSAGNLFLKDDTIRFRTRREDEYGRVMLRFNQADSAVRRVIQFLQGNEVKYSFPLQNGKCASNRILPGEYSLRILFDDNNNGIWDPGSLSARRQPERVISIRQKLSVRADWDNERDISY